MSAVVEIQSVADYDKTIGQDKPVLVEVGASWCPPCKALAPILERLAAAPELADAALIAKIDLDEQPEVVQKVQELAGMGIQSVPTMFMIVKGQIVGGPMIGLQPEAILKDALVNAVNGAK